MSDLFNYCNDPDLWKESGKRIADRRKQLGMRFTTDLSKTLSAYSSSTRQHIAEWEHGEKCINKLCDLAALCKVLECDPEYITCQCDTLRKKNEDPLKRSGLLESSINILSDSIKTLEEHFDFLTNAPMEKIVPFYDSLEDPEDSLPYEEENLTIKRMGKERFIKENNATAIVINFLLGHYELILTLFDYLQLAYGLNELTPGNDTNRFTDSLQYDPIDNGFYTITPNRKRYIIEQEFIHRLRRAVTSEYEKYGPDHIPGTSE